MPLLRRVRHVGEYVLVRALLGVFGLLSIDRASALGGALCRTVGPRLGISNRARINLERAFPEYGAAAREAVLAGMWDNLGRVLAEYPHLDRFLDPGGERIEVVGGEHIRALRDDGIGGFCVGGHIGNWEIPPVLGAREGLPLAHVYRALNNPLLDRFLRRLRAPAGGSHHAKGPSAARGTVAALRRGAHIGILVDQKFNEGIAAPFFGRDAMTSTTPARLAFRYDVPIVCVRLERLGGARFRFTVTPPLRLPDTGDREADIASVTRSINTMLEGWIRERPEQWLWLHRRWPREEPASAPASARRHVRDRDESDTS